MENTINTAVEAVEAVNEIGFKIPDKRDLAIFGAGVVTAIFTEKVVIPTGKKVVDKCKTKFGKKKPIEVAAEEIIEVEE